MRRTTLALCLLGLLLFAASDATALPQINVQLGEDGETAGLPLTLKILALTTVLTLAPALAMLLTSFTRIVIVFSFLKHAIGQQQMPPNQILVGLAMFLTVFVMAPVWQEVNVQALQPLLHEEIAEKEAWQRAEQPIRQFMMNHTREKDLGLFVSIAGMTGVSAIQEVPTWLLVPAFVISELTTAFQIGFLLFIPFLVVDMVVASVLMSMGMMMLPPVMISMPFKILLFVLVDGWYLLTHSLVMSFA